MNSRKPSFDDGLGDLIRKTVKAKVDRQEPPDTIWYQIADKLEVQDVPIPQKSRLMAPLPVAQAIFVVLLIVIGGLGLQSSSISSISESISDDAQPILVASLPQSDAERYMDEYSAPLTPITVADKIEGYPHKSMPVDDLELGTYPIATIPFDVMPHPMSPEGRLLNLGPSKSEKSENIVEVVEGFEPIMNQGVY